VAGATGTLGRPTVQAMVAAGHEVRGLARSAASATVLRGLGAVPVAVADFFDAREVHDAVAGSEAIVHLATRIPPLRRMRKRAAWRDNDRLRSQGSSILVNAALAHGIRIYVQQSVTFLYQDLGETVLYETAPVDAAWPLGSARDAEREASRVTARGGQGVVLRLASLYGPAVPSTREMMALARWRLLPVLGSGAQYVSSIHVEDAATAVAAALAVPAGIYNVADDEPVTMRAYVAALARSVGARAPFRIPPRLVRPLLGPAGEILARSQRVANTMFRSVSGWTPRYPSVHDGLASR
jgi:nucleoside-diphosphate-sugar epimerase